MMKRRGMEDWLGGKEKKGSEVQKESKLKMQKVAKEQHPGFQRGPPP